MISEVMSILLEDGPKRWSSGYLANFEVSEVKKDLGQKGKVGKTNFVIFGV